MASEIVRDQRYERLRAAGKDNVFVNTKILDSEKIYKFNTDLINSQSYNYSWWFQNFFFDIWLWVKMGFLPCDEDDEDKIMFENTTYT